jgi:hypothetical protein
LGLKGAPASRRFAIAARPVPPNRYKLSVSSATLFVHVSHRRMEARQMPSRTSSGLLLPVIMVVGLVAVFGGSKVVSVIDGIFSGNDR